MQLAVSVEAFQYQIAVNNSWEPRVLGLLRRGMGTWRGKGCKWGRRPGAWRDDPMMLGVVVLVLRDIIQSASPRERPLYRMTAGLQSPLMDVCVS